MTEYRRAHVYLGPIGTEAASAAMYLAWIAYPHSHQKAARLDFVKAVCAGIAKGLGKHPPKHLQGIKRERIVGKANRGLDRINKRRLPSVRMALQQMGVDPHGIIGLNAAARSWVELTERKSFDGQGPEPDNVRKDVWRDSRPALAMMLALPLEMATDDQKTVLDLLLREHGWVPQAIQDANRIAPMMVKFFNPPTILLPKTAKSPVCVSQ